MVSVRSGGGGVEEGEVLALEGRQRRAPSTLGAADGTIAVREYARLIRPFEAVMVFAAGFVGAPGE